MATAKPDKDITTKIDEHSDDLEALADSDLPCADVAAALLEVGSE